MDRSFRWFAWTIVAYLLAAAAFELALAVGQTKTPSGEGFVALAALVAMLVGAALTFRRGVPARMMAPAAALFVVARFYTGDLYYDPSYRSYADGGIFSPVWIYLLLAFALSAWVTAQIGRRRAAIESVVLLPLLMFTTVFMGSGH